MIHLSPTKPMFWELNEPDPRGGRWELRLEGAPSGSAPWGRWSYYLGAPSRWIKCDAKTLVTTLVEPRGRVRKWTDPLEALRWLTLELRERPGAGLGTTGAPPFKGGWVGWLSYDVGRLFEELPAVARDDLDLPLFEFTYHETVLAREGHQRAGPGVTIELSDSAGNMRETLPAPAGLAVGNSTQDAPLHSTFARDAYIAAVARTIEYVGAGDVFQVNLSQRFTAPLRESPASIYARLRRASPAWFGAYLAYDDHALLSTSPELFLRVTPDPTTGKRHVLTRPIKGTRPRGSGKDTELRDSLKDQAELNMIVDLERNDLGRVCEIGSVLVSEARAIETHPTIIHGVASVEGVLRNDVTFVDLLRATFPGGSVTGAPKIRAMQILE
ncbi:MAG: anthranilate synthase component I family protein, partial [Tepidisphaeraceae bacterium]